MPKVVQINVMAGHGSIGRISDQIGSLAQDSGWESWIAYGRGCPSGKSKLIRIGNRLDAWMHAAESRIFDNHGLASRRATKKFVEQLERMQPDVVHLHNIHGYFLNYPILFRWLKEWGGPVVWTLHDCWAFTGHCAYYSHQKCDKWRRECNDCPQLRRYPSSIVADNSTRNFRKKKETFCSIDNLTLVGVSEWLGRQISESFLGKYPVHIFPNGIDTKAFRPGVKTEANSRHSVLGVANVWDYRKGLDDFIKLRTILPSNYDITLVGLSAWQAARLPKGIRGIKHNSDMEALAEIYSKADVYVNPTVDDNFPTTLLEAMACGTPVVSYDTGGCREAIVPAAGRIVVKGDANALAEAVTDICENRDTDRNGKCRQHAVDAYNMDINLRRYISLYETLLKKDGGSSREG